MANRNEPARRKQCPHCKEFMHKDATKCPHCHEKQPPSAIAVLVAALILLPFMVWFGYSCMS